MKNYLAMKNSTYSRKLFKLQYERFRTIIIYHPLPIITFLPWTENLQIQIRMTQQFLIESRYFKRGKQKHTIYAWKIFSELWNITQRYRNMGTNKHVSPRDRWFVRLGRFSSGFRSRDLGILVCVYALIRADRRSRIVAYLKASVPRFRKPSV